jgi:hypothetical protein
MLRTIAALGALGALALVLTVSLSGGDHALSRLLGKGPHGETLVNANTGETLTLEAVRKDVEWHRDTARKLRELN